MGTERHQTARSAAESTEKIPNYVLQVFTGTATSAAAPMTERVRHQESVYGRPWTPIEA
jgi:hypothetical protein